MPYQLMHYGLGLAERMQFVDLLVDWITLGAAQVVRSRLNRLLAHTPSLTAWLSGATSSEYVTTLLALRSATR